MQRHGAKGLFRSEKSVSLRARGLEKQPMSCKDTFGPKGP